MDEALKFHDGEILFVLKLSATKELLMKITCNNVDGSVILQTPQRGFLQV